MRLIFNEFGPICNSESQTRVHNLLTAVATLGITGGQWGMGLGGETGFVLGLSYCVLY